jgi:hypothetical protein
MRSVDAAVWAARRGWTVVPARPGEKRPFGKWGHITYRDPETVMSEWPRGRWAVCVATGPSHLICDDIDIDKSTGDPAGAWSLENLLDGDWDKLPPTFTVATPSGGMHIVWQNVNGKEYKSCAGQIAPFFDVRGRGGQFVLWDPSQPSRMILDDRDPVAMPAWLDELHPDAGSAPERMADIPNVRTWLNEHGQGGMCEVMSGVCNRYARALRDGDSVHDTMRDAQNVLAGERHDGHKGLVVALDVIEVAFEKAMRGKSRHNQWRDDWWNSLSGAIRNRCGRVSDEDPCDLDFSDFNPYRGKARDGVYIDDVEDRDVEWLCKPWFPFASLVIIDGDPGQGKSMMTSKVVANASSGIEILPSSESYGEPIRCGLIASEDDDYIIKGRLRAAGYKFDRSVVVMNTRYRGKYLKFPEGAKRVRKFITENNLDLLIIDPISQYIGEKIQTHNESSVRDALGPIQDIAQETGACIVMVRHLNKNGDMKAMYRGGGSIAFSALARSGMITGELPNGRFAIAQVKCSYARKFQGALAYSVVEWEENEEIPVIEWHGEEDIDVNDLTKGPRNRKGPEPTSQNAIREVLDQLFETKDTWPSNDVIQQLKDAGCSTDQKTVDKVRAELGITARPVRRPDKKYAGWEWSLKEVKQSARQDSKDSKRDPFDEKGPFDE